MIFYRIYQIFIMLPLLLILTVLASLATVAGCSLGGGRWWGYYPAHYWAKCWCWLAFIRVSVRGRENIIEGNSYVFVANHQSAYDIFSVYGYLGHQFRWMMKKSLEKIPLVGFACRKAGHIYVDRHSPAAVRQTMQTAEKQLAGGMSVVVFPEGSRTKDGHTHSFRRGAYMLAMEFSLPVVPVTIDGAYDVLPPDALLMRPGRIVLTIHKPIQAGEGGHDLNQLMEQSRQAIISALPEKNR
ncbi:MAG: 1-acyl-sn-glycerol-3-phosphate acyltransferase [Muribaculaceae bacterium]|nr:1-acyl-sn-glycerol-3-phosphate acyltransferase [Muribaculaceae bacterium]